MSYSNTAAIPMPRGDEVSPGLYAGEMLEELRKQASSIAGVRALMRVSDTISKRYSDSLTSTSPSIAQGVAALLCMDYNPELLIATNPPWELELYQYAQTHPHFSVVLTRLKNLFRDATEDEDADAPSLYAFQKTMELLYSTFADMNQQTVKSQEALFPLASVATDEDGGIHVYWRSLERNVHVAIPPDENGSAFLYHSTPTAYKVEKPLTPGLLSSWLAWYTNA